MYTNVHVFDLATHERTRNALIYKTAGRSRWTAANPGRIHPQQFID